MNGPLLRQRLAVLVSLATATALAQESPAPSIAPARSVAEEAALLEKGRTSAQQRALARLATRVDPVADDLLLAQFARYRGGTLPPALWLDLFEAAAKRSDPRVQAILAESERELEKSSDPLTRFRMCLVGGDGEAGRDIFTKKPEAACIRCHTIDGAGGQIGPDLTWHRHSVEPIRILESIILPNSTIALGFQPATLTLKSGDELTGVITQEGSDELTLTSIVDGKRQRLQTCDIAERHPLPSPMPPSFGAMLSRREIRDLVEFLAQGD